MTTFEPLIQIEGTEEYEKKKTDRTPLGRRTGGDGRNGTRGAGSRGCAKCPLDRIKGINKIFGKVRGKEIFVWGQSPGAQENKAGIELVGKAGEWWWREAKAAGLTREMCDIQNVVRCFPADYDDSMWPPLQPRHTPLKAEIKCCSIYNEQALERSQAKVHIVLGQVAAKVLLGKEYKKDQRIFWSERMKGKVVCLDHPAFFLRRGEGQERVRPGSDQRLRQFRRDLRYATQQSKGGGRYAYLEEQDYQGIVSPRQARRAYREILQAARGGRRVSLDIEDGWVDGGGFAATECEGRRAILVVGFCARPGSARVFAIDHPDSPAGPRARRYNRRIVTKLLQHRAIRYALQYGSSDVQTLQELWGVRVRHYDYDTIFGEFFAHPEKHSYALDTTSAGRYPEFAGYKEIKIPDGYTESFKATLAKGKELAPWQQIKRAKTFKGAWNLARIPWKKIVLYNGADNDLQKRIEVSTKPHVHMPLMHVYRDAQFVLNWMERNPPRFDYKHYDKLVQIYPVLMARALKRLRKMVGRDDFNPNSVPQVAKVVYDQLRLPQLTKKRTTAKEVMQALSGYHPFPGLQVEFKRLNKICGTYMAGFKASADANLGCVRTIWWLTGTRTGRLSSGGGDSGENGVVNLQNIHGDPLLQCLLISDVRWRQLYRDWRERTEIRVEGRDKDTGETVYGYIGGFDRDSWKPYMQLEVFLGFDHSQMELRVVAQKCGDPELVRIFQQRLDLHAEVGHALTGWPVKVLQEDERKRRMVKGMQFGIVYGLNARNLIPYLRAKGVREEDVSDADILRYYKEYFRRFRRVKQMIDDDHEFAQENGYVETMFGFRRPLEVEQPEEGGAYWANQAVNTPIQGTAHQLMLIGLVPLKRKPVTYKLLGKPQLEIHDAVYFRVRLAELFEAAKVGQYMLEKEALQIVKKDFGIDWEVPLAAEPKAAFRFGVQQKLKKGMTEWQFLNAWCERNHKLEIRLREETRKVQA